MLCGNSRMIIEQIQAVWKGMIEMWERAGKCEIQYVLHFI